MQLLSEISLAPPLPISPPFFSNPTLLSPDCQTLCISDNNSVHFLSSSPPRTFTPDPTLPKITSLATLSTNPWVICAGYDSGAIITFTPTSLTRNFGCPHSGPVHRIHVCNYRETALTDPGRTVLIQYSKGIVVTFSIDKLNLAAGEVKPTIWQLPHNSPADCILIYSKLTSQTLFSGSNQSPAVFAVGAQPFLSVASIVEESAVSTTRGFFGWMRMWGAKTIQNAKEEWNIVDERRVAREVVVSEDGRWIAVADGLGRVTIIDCIFGHITKILKGMRDAQVAWSHLGYLLIFAPARRLIVACNVPLGEIFDAVKVDKRGRLVQFVDGSNRLGVVFIDSEGRFGQIVVERPPQEVVGVGKLQREGEGERLAEGDSENPDQ